MCYVIVQKAFTCINFVSLKIFDFHELLGKRTFAIFSVVRGEANVIYFITNKNDLILTAQRSSKTVNKDVKMLHSEERSFHKLKTQIRGNYNSHKQCNTQWVVQ